MKIEIVPPITIQISENYGLVFTDAQNYTYYFNHDGTYDGWSCDPDDCKEWAGAKVQCDICTYQWIAVFNVNCERLECPNCHNMVEYEIIEIN